MKSKKNTATKWYVLMGYNKDDEDNTGMLSIDAETNNRNIYKIVHDVKDAAKFPDKNVDNVSGFGTPEQWLKFFSSEPLLQSWKFHLMRIKHNKDV